MSTKMACDVDELDINPFFRALQTKFSDLYSQAQEKCYTICIPLATTILKTNINKDFAETHILKPSPYFKGELLSSHSSNSKSVTLADDGCSITTCEGFQTKLTVKIVSEELAYNKEYNHYRILIIDQPLDLKFQQQNASDGNDEEQKPAVYCLSPAECKEFLQSFPEFSEAMEKVDQSVRLFNVNYMVLPDYLPEAASRLADISTEAVTSCLKSLGRKNVTDIGLKDTLVTAMETYIMNGVHKKVHRVVMQCYAEADECLKRKCRTQLKGISAEALGIRRCFVCPLPDAVQELNKLDAYVTPREKLTCLKSVIDAVISSITAYLSRDIPPHLVLTADKPRLTSDDLIPILVNVIGQSDCRHLQTDIVYIETFAWASSAKDIDDLSYCLVTFKAAVHYILTTDFSHLPHKNSIKKQVSTDRFSSAASLPVSNGSSTGDKSPSSCHFPTPSPVATSAGDRLGRQMSRISKALEDSSQMKGKGSEKVKSIFGAEYDISATLENTTRSRASPELGDFLSSLQDDFLDQPFGKQA